MTRSFRFWNTQVSIHIPSLLAGISLTALLCSGNIVASAQNPIDSLAFWRGIFRSDPPIPPSEGGGRGEVCLIAPFAPPDQIAAVWQTHPTFVWQGRLVRIEVYESGQNEALWESVVTGYKSALYEGTPLTPGKTYEWYGYLSEAGAPAFKVPFTVLPDEQQEAIAHDLEQLEESFPQATSSEEQAIQRADYFAARSLWSDFWGEVLSVETPSGELEEALDEMELILCEH